MSWNTTYELAEQHRNEMLHHAAQARLARTVRKDRNTGNAFRSLVARFARTTTQPVVIAKVDTLPVPAERSAAA